MPRVELQMKQHWFLWLVVLSDATYPLYRPCLQTWLRYIIIGLLYHMPIIHNTSLHDTRKRAIMMKTFGNETILFLCKRGSDNRFAISHKSINRFLLPPEQWCHAFPAWWGPSACWCGFVSKTVTAGAWKSQPSRIPDALKPLYDPLETRVSKSSHAKWYCTWSNTLAH